MPLDHLSYILYLTRRRVRLSTDRRMGRGSEAHTVNNHTYVASWPGPRRQRRAPRRRRRRSLALRARAFSTILGSSPLSHVAAAATTTTMLHCVPREGGKALSLTGLGGAPRRCGWIEGNWTDYGRTACTVVVGSASSGFGLEWMDDRSVKTLEAEASRVSEVLRGLV